MKEFKELLEITEKLIGPDGCPWDQQQTFDSLRNSVHEEVHELIEAIDLGDPEQILEELGDLFFNAVFFCKVAEKEKKFKTEQVLREIIDKLIRRHPHVFGDAQVSNIDELYVQWESIKETEKGKEKRTSALDSIPKGLPSLSRASKMVKKFKKCEYSDHIDSDKPLSDEEQFGEKLFELVKEGKKLGFDAEDALRRVLNRKEERFRNWEKKL